MVNTWAERHTLGNIRQVGAAPIWTRGLVALLAATASLIAAAPAAHAGSDTAMGPNKVLDVEAFDGAQFRSPQDGRVRGYDFAIVVTETGPVSRARRIGGWLTAGDGQRLVGFKLRLDQTQRGMDHRLHGALIVDGARIPAEDYLFSVREGEHAYVASIPAGAAEVQLELSAAGLAQVFSLTTLARVGAQPTVLYRDGLSPDVVKDIAGERTLRLIDVETGGQGALVIDVEKVRLSFFTPPEPVTPADDPARAYLVIEADADAGAGRQAFDAAAALPGSALTATLPDGTVVEAIHSGPEDEELLSGAYYFPLPADVEAVRLTITPGTFDAWPRGETGAVASPVRAEGAAVFDIEFTPGAAAKLPKLPKEATATTIRPGADGEGGAPESDGSNGGLVPVVLLLALAVSGGAGILFARNHLGRGATQPDDVDAAAAAPPSVSVGPMRLPPVVTLTGEGALDAARAAVTQELDDGHSEVVVVAVGAAAALEACANNGARVVFAESDLSGEVEAAVLSAARAAAEAAEDGSNGRAWSVLIVGPGESVHRAASTTASTGMVVVRVVALDGSHPPVVSVDASGVATLPDGGRGRLPLVQAIAAEAAVEPVEADAPAPEAPASTGAEPSRPLVEVALLGAYRVSVAGKEGTGGWRNTARELLALLAVHPEGLTLEAAIEEMWPSMNFDKARVNFRQAVKNLRKMLRPPSGVDAEWTPVELSSGRYRLDSEVIIVDVREFEGAARAAASSDKSAAQRAIDLYRDKFAAGEDFVWAEPHRERLRRTVQTVIARLVADCRAGGDLQAAEVLLDRAINIDPGSEPLYRDLMEVQRAQGNEDGVRRTYARLEAALANLGLRPTARTRALLTVDTSFPS